MSPQEIVPLLTGAFGCLIALAIGNWYQAKEKAALQAIIKGKDDDLKGLTRETVASITTLAGLNQTNQEWQKSVSQQLSDIKDNLP